LGDSDGRRRRTIQRRDVEFASPMSPA
jgi:hypothetical protein